MANKADRFYFENLAEAAEISKHAAEYLVEVLNNYDYNSIDTMLKKMHEYEHLGDDKKHEMSQALAKAFVTPIEREDLALISQNIDEVTDQLEEVLQRFYIDNIKSVSPHAKEFADKLVLCCSVMFNMLTEFSDFKKSKKLHEMVIELNHLEEECDELYLEAALNAKKYSNDILELIFVREIYDKMENCADACEHIGDCVEMVVMKNT